MRRQLREFYRPDQLAEVYAQRYDHTLWDEHVARVDHTAKLLSEMLPATVADLSCGDAAIIDKAGLREFAILGDLVPGWNIQGPIEQTVRLIPPVDVFVLAETLEHVADPDGLLAAIRNRAQRLLLSTPVGEDHALNPEHYWGWDLPDVDEMLAAAGWTQRDVEVYSTGDKPYYVYQIWICA